MDLYWKWTMESQKPFQELFIFFSPSFSLRNPLLKKVILVVLNMDNNYYAANMSGGAGGGNSADGQLQVDYSISCSRLLNVNLCLFLSY